MSHMPLLAELTPESDALISLRGVGKSYATHSGSFAALHDVTLDIRRGEFIEKVEHDGKTELLDQRYARSIGQNGLIYHTAPLSAQTEFVGFPRIRLWLSIDTLDTDFAVNL